MKILKQIFCSHRYIRTKAQWNKSPSLLRSSFLQISLECYKCDKHKTRKVIPTQEEIRLAKRMAQLNGLELKL